LQAAPTPKAVDGSQSSDNPDGGVPNEWRLTVPGALGDHNADRVEGQTLIWNLEPGEKAVLHAESAVGLDLTTLGL
jgi:hypothetical protein